MSSNRSLILIVSGALAASTLIAGCASSKPAPVAIPGPAVDDGTQRRAAEEAARQEAERRAREEVAARVAREEAARMARQFTPLYFDYDSDLFRDQEKDMLADYARRLVDHADLSLILEGHCDERGTTAYNLALGQRRADSVRNYLLRAGVSPDRLATVSYGKERPADRRRDESGWSLNRRVELVPAN